MKHYSVLISCPHQLERKALALALASRPRIRIVAACEGSAETLLQTERLRPTVVLLAAKTGYAEYHQVCRAIKERLPGTKVVITSDLPDEEILLGAVEAGADGYVPGNVGLAALTRSLRRVASGETVIPPTMLGGLLTKLVSRRRRRDAATLRFDGLSQREREVLALMVAGADRHRMAEQLMISPETARTHIHNVISKLGARSRVEALTMIVEQDLLE